MSCRSVDVRVDAALDGVADAANSSAKSAFINKEKNWFILDYAYNERGPALRLKAEKA